MQGFIDHPLTRASDNADTSDYPQLWQPFGDSFDLSTESNWLIEGFASMGKFTDALASYKRRYLGLSKTHRITINPNQTIKANIQTMDRFAYYTVGIIQKKE
ncbi:hypothetical protein [Parasitella parasitica]|uniref:Uncharacterized protein n=1 Tax=Parasitella parasitica TaxID=35722 RepID=A0A0B7NDP4_9FUNG|nr:hypothetical protein [Parasitella parasitica]